MTITTTIEPKDFAGENISKLSQQMQAAFHFLDNNQCKPSDCNIIALNAFQKCSVQRFNDHFNVLETTQSPILKDAFAMLDEATRIYEHMILEGTWTAKSHKPSAYQFQQRPNNRQAPPSTPAPTTARPNNRTPRMPVDITPPAPGEPHERVRADGKTITWCTRDRCCIKKEQNKNYQRPGRWTTHPNTDEGHNKLWAYVDEKNKQRKDKQKQKKANAAASDGTARASGYVAATPHPRPTIRLTEAESEAESESESEPESTTTTEPEEPEEKEEKINEPQANHAAWWATTYLN